MEDFFEIISKEVEQIEGSSISTSIDFNEVSLWPILRIGFYMSRKRELSGYNNSKTTGKVVNHFKNYLVKKIIGFKSSYSIQNKTRLYFGANTHRSRLNGKFLNRYFSHKITNSSILIEYDNSILFLDKNSVDIWSLIQRSQFESEVLKLNQNSELQERLLYFKSIFKNLYEDVIAFTINVLAYQNLFKKLFEESSVEEIFFLSYYSAPSFGACIAANHLNIKTIEVQHGPIGKYHLAYSPGEYFDFKISKTTPYEIHLWHTNFLPVVNQMFYKSCVTGNYYLNEYRVAKMRTDMPLKILISLQPKDSNIPEIYQTVITEFKETYCLVIRLHPRIKKNKSLNSALRTYRKMGIKISDPYSTPLHKDFENCVLHLTGYSGTTIEASSMNIPSILYDPKAKFFFQNFVDNKSIFFDFNKNREENLKLIYSCLGIKDKI